MNQRHLSRKERRKLIKQKHRQQIIKKSGALVGTTMVLGTLGIGAVPFTQAAPATAAESANATSVDKFIETLAPYAQETASANDLYASVMLAQAIVESGWGQSSLSTAPNHNLFGITGAYQGASIALSTQEFLNQNWSTVVQNFRKYPSYTESFQDNANVIKNTVLGGKSYYSGAWKSNASNYKEATAYLTGRYATAPNYDQVLNQIIEKYNLTQYDAAGSAAQTTDNSTAANEAVLTPLAVDTTNQTTNTAADTTAAEITENGLATHTVIAGESVWGISHAYGMTMKDFKALNGIGSNNFVYPGMIVKVANVQTETNASTEATGTHIVRTGESVWGISHAYGMSMDEFKTLNGIGANNFVYPGMVVKVTGAQTETAAADVPEATGTYTVQAGESVWSISHAHGMTMEGFKALNGIGDDNFVYAGMVVKISGTAATPATEETAAPAEEAQTPAPTETTPAATEEAKTETPATTEEPAANLPAVTGTYTVKAGDSVWSIADAYGMTMADFKALNGIGDDNYVYPGLVVKTSGEVKQAAETPAQPAAPAENTQTDSNQAAATNQTATDQTQPETVAPEQSTTPAVETNGTYTVKAGDSVWSVANAHGMSMNDFKTANGIGDDNYMYPGMTVKVSGQAAVDSTTTEQSSQVQTDQNSASNTTNNSTNNTTNNTATFVDYNKTNNNTQPTGGSVIDIAYQQIGKPYVWGAKGPDSFDCSGFVRYCYLQATGRDIGGWTVPQESAGSRISVGEAQAGDLYFWGTPGGSYHVALALGNGQYIHAPQPGETVTVGSVAYYAPSFAVRM